MVSSKLLYLRISLTLSDSYPKASGVGLSDECVKDYQDLKLGRKYQYIIFDLGERNTRIITNTKGEVNSDELTQAEKEVATKGEESGLTKVEIEVEIEKAKYEVFYKELPDDECRWAVYDFGYEVEGGRRNKLIFLSW